jgi:undecaprenyl-diphosphatase
MAVVSWLSALRTVLALFALAMAIAIVRRDWYRVLTGILAVPGGILLNDLLLRNLFQRPRPPWHLAYTVPTTYGFPSGDAVAATLLYGFVAVSLLRSVVTHWKWRTLIDLTAMLVILLVGFSRVYLGDHYLSDVLGGYAAGIAWLVLCLIAVRTLEQARAQQAPEP